MNQTANQGYNLVENTDEIQTSLNAWNGNFNKIDADVTKLQTNIKVLEDNFDTATTSNSNNFILEDSASGYMPRDDEGNPFDIKIGDGPELEQKTTEGKNLLNIAENNMQLTSGGSGTPTVTFDGQSFTVTGKSGGIFFYVPYINGETHILKIKHNGNFTNFRTYKTDKTTTIQYLNNITSSGEYIVNLNPTDEAGYYIRFYVSDDSNAKLEFAMISTTGGDYEEYTGKQASPNPSYPQDINAVERNSIAYTINKNLGWKDWANDFVNRINNTQKATIETYDSRNCLKFWPNAGSEDYDNLYMFKILGGFKENTRYTFKFQTYSVTEYADLQIIYTDGTSTEIRHLTPNTWDTVLFTSVANKTIKYLKTRWRNNEFKYIDLDTFMVYEGTDDERYIPNKYQIFPLTLPEGMFLGSIGTASNYIRGTKDNWKLVSSLGKFMLDGSESWRKADDTLVDRFIWNTFKATTGILTVQLSNYFRKVEFGSNVPGGIRSNTTQLIIDFSEYGTTTLEQFQQWLSQHSVEGYGLLETSTETDITDTTLIQQLNNIADNLQTYKGQTVVFTTSDNLEPNIQFDYLQNPLASIEARLDLLEE